MAKVKKTETSVSQQQDEARTTLIEAVNEASQVARRTGPVYAKVVRGVIACMDANMARQQISNTIASAWAGGEQKQVSKGIGARYIILARYQRKEYLDNERHLRASVEVGGKDYPSPLDALESGETFNSVYDAWTAAVKVRQEPAKVPTSAFVAARQAIGRLFVRVQQNGDTARVKLEESAPAFAGAMSALMATPTAVQVIPPRTRHSVLEALKRASRSKAA